MEDWLDGSLAPIWQQRWPTRYGDDEVHYAFDRLDDVVGSYAEGHEPISLLVDISRTRVGTPVQRKRISQTFRRTQAIASHVVVCQAFVVRTKMQRGALTATLWLFDPGWEIRVFASMGEAVDWARGMHETLTPRLSRRP
ncbi:MAG: hypothetical protein AAF411_27910 [Myxococcota bacterium]